MSDDLGRVLEGGEGVLAYVRGGEVVFWESVSAGFTGEIELHFRSGGVSTTRQKTTRHYAGQDEVNIREG